MNPEKTIPPRLNYTTLPIFFVQRGEPGLFIKKVLKQAELSNGKENVYLLTDANFDYYKEFNCIDISKYIPATAEFGKLYKHHSANTPFFEKVCFDRWFIINALIKDLNINYFFHADNDVLLLAGLNPVYEYLLEGNYNGSTMYFEHNGDSVTSGHSSFWSSKLLDAFCTFVCKKYVSEAEFSKLLKDTLAGKFLDNKNVSDMILLDLFRTETKPNVLNLFSLEERNIVLDFNINVAYNGYKHSFIRHSFFKIKKMKRYKDGLYGQVTGSETNAVYVKFYSLHFQGYLTKSLIPIYLTSKSSIEQAANYLSGVFVYFVRKMRLFKNHIKGKMKAYLAK